MDSDRLWENLMELSVVCGMNQRYAQYMLTWAECIGTWIDIAVVTFTMLTLALGVAAYLAPNRPITLFAWWWSGWHYWKPPVDGLAMATSIPAAIAGIILIVSPVSRDVQHYGSMFQAWSDLRQDVDSAITDLDASEQLGDAYFDRRFRDLLAKKNALNSREPAPNQEKLNEFLALEEQSRAPQAEPPKTRRTATTSAPTSPGI